MNHHIQSAKSYITTNKKEFIVGMAVIFGGLVLIAAIGLSIYNSTPKIVYQPVKACDLLSLTEAQALLGDKSINTTSKDPVLSRTGNTAVSNCGYADGSADKENMIVAAIIVRSGVNDTGVQQNKTEFSAGKPSRNVELVKDLGDSAYFNQELGQLNILESRKWIILSYGIGSAPETNTVEKSVELARAVLR